MNSYEGFLQQLREALSALYDPATLRRNGLRQLLGPVEGANHPTALRDLLIDAIESLRPAHETPAQMRAWRIYDLLHFRFVQQFGPDEVADQLGISARHLRREQHAALEALAARLQERYLPSTRAESPPPDDDKAGPQWHQELAWLQDAPPEQGVNLHEGLPSVLALVTPLAQQHQVALELQMDTQPLAVAMHPVALRQLLLGVLDTAIHASARGRVLVTAQPEAAEIAVEVVCSPGAVVRGEPDAELRMTRRLARLCGCIVDVSTADDRFAAHLLLPALGRLPVLVIDDNPDTLELLRRYAAGTRYHILVTRDPDQALGLAQQITPQIIVLDVMMPQIDGWEVLGRLRQHPRTGQIPVVVCSILTQEELALALGASGFVQKPVTRQNFLAALDRLSPLGQPVHTSQPTLN